MIKSNIACREKVVVVLLFNIVCFKMSNPTIKNGNKIINKLTAKHWKFYMMAHLPFSAHGLFFLSGAWINGSFFSFSSTYSRILQKKLKFN